MKKRDDRLDQIMKLTQYTKELKEDLLQRVKEKEAMEEYLKKNIKESKICQLEKIKEKYKEELKEVNYYKSNLRDDYNRVNQELTY